MTEENWEAIEKMVKKIMNDCMGGALYNALDGLLEDRTFAIQFDLNASTSTFDGNTITLNNWESNSLFHEMFHAYQAYQEIPATYNGALANLDVEASIAQYRYLQSLPEVTPGSKWMQTYNESIGQNISLLSEYLSDKGALIDQEQALEFSSLFSGTGFMIVDKYATGLNQTVTFDYNRSVSQNLKNLSNLSKGC